MPNSELSPLQNYPIKEQLTEVEKPVSDFLVQFWGVRGLIPSPGNNTSRYGGNTACVEMQVGKKRLIFDGGTGLRLLGRSLLPETVEAHVFFTNSQSNRIQGFPFFAPAFIAENSFHIYGTAALNGASIKQCLCDQMLQPHFPYPLQIMQSDLHFHNFAPGKVFKVDDITIATALINHHQKSVGYRVTWQNHDVAYITDLHHSLSETDKEHIAQLTKGVDLLIANATYTPPSIRTHQDAEIYWKTAVDLAQNLDAKLLVISHHHPDDGDDFLDEVQTEVQSIFPKAMLAREGLVLTVTND
jgi:phosphoribosyl 1,2-cyclic phosphodiesterase